MGGDTKQQRTQGCKQWALEKPAKKEDSKMIDLNDGIVLDGGLIDPAATLKNVSELVSSYNAGKANDVEVLGAAIVAVFADYPGMSITKPSLRSFSVAKLTGVTPANHDTFEERADEVIDSLVASGVLTHASKRSGYALTSQLPVKA